MIYGNTKTIHKVAMSIVTIITGSPAFIKLINVIECPAFSAKPDVTTFAEAPISVPLPPKHAPSAKAHHKIFASTPGITCERYATIGSIVAVKGILSTIALITAETHNIK